MAKLVNLTPHTINIILGDQKIDIAPSGDVARLSIERVLDGEINGIPVYKTVYGDIVDLPDPADDTIYIVSALVGVKAAKSGRTDIVGPDTGNAIRENGNIVGVPGFARF